MIMIHLEDGFGAALLRARVFAVGPSVRKPDNPCLSIIVLGLGGLELRSSLLSLTPQAGLLAYKEACPQLSVGCPTSKGTWGSFSFEAPYLPSFLIKVLKRSKTALMNRWHID